MTTAKAPKVLQFTAWSFSRWIDWRKCPAFACYKHLQKHKTPAMLEAEANPPDEENPLQRGARVAGATAKFLTKRTKNIPIELMPMAATYRDLRKRGNLSVEQSWGFTSSWAPCSPTDWNRCWLRVQIDVAYIEETKDHDILHIKDNKTGKFRPEKNEEYMFQLHLYGTAALTLMPSVGAATTELLYSDLGFKYPESGPKVYLQKDAARMRKEWEKLVKPMMNDRRFAPRPGRYCNYCEFSREKGGPCRY